MLELGLSFNIDFKQGVTRNVLLIGGLAFKFPTFNNHINFLNGCYSNYSERRYYNSFVNAVYEGNLVKHACPSYFCSLFGLIQIQARCKPNPNDLTEDQIKLFSGLAGTDIKKENFGYFKGKLVCIDYP